MKPKKNFSNEDFLKYVVNSMATENKEKLGLEMKTFFNLRCKPQWTEQISNILSRSLTKIEEYTIDTLQDKNCYFSKRNSYDRRYIRKRSK